MNGTKSKISDLDKLHTDGWNPKAKKEAPSYIKELTDFPFIVSLITVYSLLHPLAGVTERFLGRTVDIVKVLSRHTKK